MIIPRRCSTALERLGDGQRLLLGNSAGAVVEPQIGRGKLSHFGAIRIVKCRFGELSQLCQDLRVVGRDVGLFRGIGQQVEQLHGPRRS